MTLFYEGQTLEEPPKSSTLNALRRSFFLPKGRCRVSLPPNHTDVGLQLSIAPREGKMTRRTFGPNDPWPALSHKDLNAQAQAARSLGWSAAQKESHGGFRVTCPSGECSFRFDSTPRNPTTAARNAKRRIRRCSHSVKHTQKLQLARDHLDAAERLIRAIESSAESHHQLDDALTAALGISKDSDALLAEAAHLEYKVASILEELLADTGLPPSVALADETAEFNLNQARSQVRPLRESNPIPAPVKEAWDRYQALRARLCHTRETQS